MGVSGGAAGVRREGLPEEKEQLVGSLTGHKPIKQVVDQEGDFFSPEEREVNISEGFIPPR